MDPIALTEALQTFEETWSPRTIATVNDYDVRLFKAKGEFAWHSHPETDELFLVVEGELTIRLHDGDVTLRAGELYVVPAGTPHQPWSEHGAGALLLEPTATVNTGDSPGRFTAERRAL